LMRMEIAKELPTSLFQILAINSIRIEGESAGKWCRFLLSLRPSLRITGRFWGPIDPNLPWNRMDGRSKPSGEFLRFTNERFGYLINFWRTNSS
jgi:hypothetical protein